jgi:serine/threonine protein kinase
MQIESAAALQRIGRFRIIDRLPSASGREVYLAQDDAGVRVVLKVLAAPERNQGLFEPKIADEASAYARLSHPNIVKVVDLFSTEGRFVVALEFVEGASLSVVLAAFKRAGVPLDDGASVYVGASMFAAIAAAHGARDEAGRAAPVLHRNVNPGNLLIGWDGSVKLGNFNVADVAHVLRDSNPGFTWGSSGYFAPERVKQQEVGMAADVYSASLVLWELLAGRKAIDQSTMTDAQMLEAMANPNVPSLDVMRPHLDPRICNALRTGLQIDPANRTITAVQMRDTLGQTLHSTTQRKRLRGMLDQARPEAQSVRSSRLPALAAPQSASPGSIELVSLLPSMPPSSAMVVESQELIASNVPVQPAVPAPAAPMVVADPFAAPPQPSAPVAPPPSPMMAPPSPAPVEPEPHTHEVQAPPVSAPTGRRTTVAVVIGGLAVFAATAIALLLVRSDWWESAPPPATAPSAAAQPPVATVAAPSATAPAVASSIAPAAPEVSASATPAAPEASTAIPSDRGVLTFPPSAAGHRVFVDGHVVGDGSQPATVRCGPHDVKIGSAGTVQHVVVPCGDTLTMTAR